MSTEKIMRTGSFFNYTRSICPECTKVLDAHILLRDSKVFMEKKCPEHGHFETEISSNSEYYLNSLHYTKPGQLPEFFSTEVANGCPNDCGLCSDHLQHTCSPILEINDRCDLDCPLCIVENQNGYDISVDNFKKAVDSLMESEKELPILLISGGEPTLHPRFFELCDYLKSGERKERIGRVLISTHGGKLAKDKNFAAEFKKRDLYASLQFDSLSKGVYPSMRGKELYDQKMECIKVIEELDIPTVLVITLSEEENTQELGALIEYGLNLEQVSSIVIQPMAHAGTGSEYRNSPEVNRLTMPRVHQLIEDQTGWLKKEHFYPVPCSHPSCYTATYLFKMEDGSYRPLPDFVDIGRYLDSMQNRAVIDTGSKMEKMIHETITNLWSSTKVGEELSTVVNSLRGFMKKAYNSKNHLSPKEVDRVTENHSKAIFIHSFMDSWDFDVSRIKKCCTHYVMEDGTLMPGCTYNNIYRQKDRRFFPDAELQKPQPVKNRQKSTSVNYLRTKDNGGCC